MKFVFYQKCVMKKNHRIGVLSVMREMKAEEQGRQGQGWCRAIAAQSRGRTFWKDLLVSSPSLGVNGLDEGQGGSR